MTEFDAGVEQAKEQIRAQYEKQAEVLDNFLVRHPEVADNPRLLNVVVSALQAAPGDKYDPQVLAREAEQAYSIAADINQATTRAEAVADFRANFRQESRSSFRPLSAELAADADARRGFPTDAGQALDQLATGITSRLKTPELRKAAREANVAAFKEEFKAAAQGGFFDRG